MSFVGNLGQAAANSALVANYKIASRYQASASFNALTMMTILSTDFTEDFTVRLGIYSDDGGEPKVLLGATGTIRGLGIEDGVYHGTLGSAVAIVAGEYYWLALMTDGDINMRATSTGTGDSREVDDDYVDGFAYEFGTGSSDTVALCIAALTRTRGGFCRGSLLYGGAVMQAPPSAGSGGGSVWAVVRSETGDVVVYQDLGGSLTPVLVAAATPTEIFGSAATTVAWVDAGMDGNGDLHIVCQPGTALNTRDVAYCVFDTSAGAFGAWEEAAALTGTPTGIARIAVDGDNKPHVVFIEKPASVALLRYTNKVSGSWLTAEDVTTAAVNHYAPDLALDVAGDVHVFYSRDSVTATYRKRTAGTWGTEDTSATAIGLPNVVMATGSPRLLAPLYGTGARDVYYGTDVDTLADTGLDSHDGTATINVASLTALNGVPVLIYVEATTQVISLAHWNGAAWVDDGALQDWSTFDRVVAEWAYFHEHQTEINFLYGVGSFLYCSSCSPFEAINLRPARGGSTAVATMSRAPVAGMFGGLNG